jgi:hypothetical protein
VVGIVKKDDLHGGIWSGRNYFKQTPPIFDNQLPRLDSLFVSHRMLASHLDDIEQTVAADIRLRASAVSVGDVPAL